MSSPTPDLPAGESELKTDDDLTTEAPKNAWWRPLALVGIVLLLVQMGLGSVVLAVSVLLLLVLLHEAGHFLAAKACKIRATQFFVGFGPKVFSFQRGETEYGMKALFLGGYVKISGMSELDKDDPKGYQKASRWKRAVVVLAGPAMNFFVAFVVAIVLFAGVGVPTSNTLTLATVGAEAPAGKAGLLPGDTIVAVDGETVTSFDEVTKAIRSRGDGVDLASRVDNEVLGEILLRVERSGETLDIEVPVVVLDGVPKIGITAEHVLTTVGLKDAVKQSAVAVKDVSFQALKGIFGLFAGIGDTVSGLFGNEVSPEHRPLSPVGAVQVGVDVGGRSVGDALSLVAMYSIFLGVFNLLPIPPLDGGHLAVNLFETVASFVKRREVKADVRVVQKITLAFVSFMLVLAMVALVLDLTQPVKL